MAALALVAVILLALALVLLLTPEVRRDLRLDLAGVQRDWLMAKLVPVMIAVIPHREPVRARVFLLTPILLRLAARAARPVVGRARARTRPPAHA
jgi:hypothetical protein